MCFLATFLMRWHMAKFRKSVKASAILFSTCVSLPVIALEDSKLWLPGSHLSHYLKLKEAALAAESLDRCKLVLRGTIDLEQSTDEHPIYRILCRQENNKTYNEMVDGLTMDTLTTKVVIEAKLSPEELELLREEEEKRKAEELRLKKLNAWNRCSEALNTKIALMDAVEWIGQYPPPPDEFEGEFGVFTVDFNAKDMYKQPLKYKVKCIINGEDAQLTIKKRIESEIHEESSAQKL